MRAQTTRQPVGPKPIADAQANFGGALVGPTFDAAGRVTALAADPTQAGRIFVGTAKNRPSDSGYRTSPYL